MNRLLEIIAKNMGKIAVALVAALIVFPWVFSSAYILRIVTVCMMYVMIALSLNLLTGFLGLMTLGQAAFWGIGAYTAAILATQMGWGMGMCMIASALMAGLLSLLVALPTMRLKGYFLTVVTLGFCEIVRLVEMNWMDLTRGPLGIAGIPFSASTCPPTARSTMSCWCWWWCPQSSYFRLSIRASGLRLWQSAMTIWQRLPWAST